MNSNPLQNGMPNRSSAASNPALDSEAPTSVTPEPLEQPVKDYIENVLLPEPIEGISGEALTALITASSHYEWEVLSREVDGQTQTIVLFGEIHNPDSEKHVQLAEDVLKHFPNRALEGIVFSNYPLSKLNEQAYDEEREGTDQNFPGAIGLSVEHEHELTGEAIDTINIISKKIVEAADALPEGETKVSLKIDPDELPASEEQLRDVIYPYLTKLLNDSKETPLQAETYESMSFFHHRLESNHRPGIFGKLHAIDTGLGYGAIKALTKDPALSIVAMSTVAFPLTTAAYIFSESPLATAAFYASLPGAAVMAGFICYGLTMQHSKLARNLFSKVRGISRALETQDHMEREETWIKSIDSFFEKRPVTSPLLVQFGKWHITGMREKTKRQGWEARLGSSSDTKPRHP